MRNYAIIKNEVVLNVHWSDLRNAKAMTAQIEGATLQDATDLPIQSGDDFIDGDFFRNGLNVTGPIKASRALESSDSVTGARGVEDLIEVLIAKGVITAADLPASLIDRLSERKTVRSGLTK